MRLVANELSFSANAGSETAARSLMSQFVQTVKVARQRNPAEQLRVPAELFQCQIADNFTINNWLAVTDRDERSFLTSSLSQVPFVRDVGTECMYRGKLRRDSDMRTNSRGKSQFVRALGYPLFGLDRFDAG